MMPMGLAGRLFTLGVKLSDSAGPATASASASASEMLRPLEVLDLPQVYAQHSVLIDFVLYLVLFNGIAQATLTRRLEGRGGRLTSAAVGTALAVALSGLGWGTGFSVLSLGPVAVLLLLGLVGIVMYRALRQLHTSAATAGALVLVLIALTVETIPGLSGILSEVFPILDLAVAIGLLTLVWKGLRHVLPKGSKGPVDELANRIGQGKPDSKSSRVPGRSHDGEPEAKHFRQELRREKPEIGRRLKGIVRRESKESRAILRELEVIRALLQKGKHPAKDRQEIAEALRRIPPKRHRLRTFIEEVKELDRRLARFDLGVLKELREAFKKIPPAERPLFKRLALEERKKVRSEQRIAIVERFVATYDANSAKSFQMAAEFIVKNETAEALKWIRAAVRYEEEARRAIKRTQSIERMLRRITRLELRQLRRAA